MLKQKAISATLWSGMDIFIRQGFQFGISVILARLLSPEEFGIIGLLYLFTGIASTFVDGGFSNALIQKQDITRIDESTVFWFNLTLGMVFMLGLWFSAPWIAEFYNLPILIPLTKLLAVNIPLSAFGALPATLLTKKLDFKSQMKIGVVTSIASGIIAIYLANQNYGVYALAAQTLTATTLSTILLLIVCRWYPIFTFSFDSVRSLFRFGGYLLASGLLDMLFNRIYTLLIGKLYGASELGFYTRAENTTGQLSGLISGLLSRVAYPVFSAANHDKDFLSRGLARAIQVVMFFNIPLMLGLLGVAENAVTVVYGEKWLPSVPLLQVLACAGILAPLHLLNLKALLAIGHSGLFFRLEMIKKIIGIALLVMGIMKGLLGLAWSQVIFSLIAFFINAYYSGVYLSYGTFKQIRDFILPLLIGLAMLAIVASIDYLYLYTTTTVLLIQIVIGTLFYMLMSILFKLSAITYLLGFKKA
jgi:teichuronic acid exporter